MAHFHNNVTKYARLSHPNNVVIITVSVSSAQFPCLFRVTNAGNFLGIDLWFLFFICRYSRKCLKERSKNSCCYHTWSWSKSQFLHGGDCPPDSHRSIAWNRTIVHIVMIETCPGRAFKCPRECFLTLLDTQFCTFLFLLFASDWSRCQKKQFDGDPNVVTNLLSINGDYAGLLFELGIFSILTKIFCV